MSEPSSPSAYYAADAYHSQQPSRRTPASDHGVLLALTGKRLPWGNTQEVMPLRLFTARTPKSLRFWQAQQQEKDAQKAAGTYRPRPFEHVELHNTFDHEVFRHAQLPFRSQFWLSLGALGKWTLLILLPVLVAAHYTVMPASEQSSLAFTKDVFAHFYSWLLGIPLLCWVVGNIVVRHFPHVWFRPPPGPKWQFNRRTGMVTVFEPRKKQSDASVVRLEAPFHAFDAFIITAPDRQGLPMNGLSLVHRLGKGEINFDDLIAPDRTTTEACTLWDFLQNYMDISRALPDMPELEACRRDDPVTAAFDASQGRNPRYWMEMDDVAFKGKVAELGKRIDAIDTFQRPF